MVTCQFDTLVSFVSSELLFSKALLSISDCFAKSLSKEQYIYNVYPILHKILRLNRHMYVRDFEEGCERMKALRFTIDGTTSKIRYGLQGAIH